MLTEIGPVGVGGAPGPGRDLRAGDRPQAAPAAEWGGRVGVLVVGQGADPWGDLRPSGGDLRGAGVQGDRSPGSPTGSWRAWWSGRTGRWTAVYPVIFIDAIVVKIREGQVANRPIYVAIGVTVDGDRDILGLWAGDGGEGAKYWAHVLTEIKNRGTKDVCIVVCDGLTGLPDAVSSVWPQSHRADLCHPPAPQQFPLRQPQGLAGDRQGPQADLHGPDRGGRPGAVGGVRRGAGRPSTRPSSGCGSTPGPSSCRSSASTPRSAR